MARKKRDVIYPKLKHNGMDSRWFVEFSVRDELTGKMIRRRISEGFAEIDTYEARMKYADKLIAEYTERIKSGDFESESELIEYRDVLLYDYVQVHGNVRRGRVNSARVLMCEFAEYKSTEVTRKTMQTYTSKLRMFSEYLATRDMESKHISEVKNNIVVDFLKDATKRYRLSRLTVEKYQQILYTFFKWVQEYKNIEMINPAGKVPRLGAVVDESAPAITSDIRARLQKVIEPGDPQLWLACCMQYYCAIRPGTELRLMKVGQIDFESRIITVRNYLAKNARTEVVDIPVQLLQMFIEMEITESDTSLYLFGKDGKPGPEPLGKNTMRNRFNAFRDQIGLSKDIKYYSWKHAGALELKNSGANMYDIQRHFRHESITTTEGYWRKRLGGISPNIKNKFPDI